MKQLLFPIWKYLIPERFKCHISRLLNHSFNVGLVGVFFDDKGRVLCFHHTYRRTPWGIPTGWLERAEQPEAALLREIAEESGLQVEILGVHKAEVDRSRLDLILVGKFLGGEFKKSDEVDDWGLFAVDALPTNIHPPQIKIIQEVSQAWCHRLCPDKH